MVSKVLRRLRARIHGEEAQALVLMAGGLVAFCGLVALSIDVGQVVFKRTDLQKSADAAALAGAQELPSPGTAQSVANDYADLNVADGAGTAHSVGVEVSTTFVANDTITVTVEQPVEFTFARALGLDGADVGAKATARVGYLSGGAGLLPWGFANDGTNDCYNGDMSFDKGMPCTVMYGAWDSDEGDFGALDVDGKGGGASEYRDTIANGSDTLYEVNDVIDVETGKMAGPTAKGVDERLSLPRPSGCGETYSELVIGGVIKAGCESHPRFGVVPIVEELPQKQQRIVGFAIVYLVGVKPGSNAGQGHTEVDVIFVEARTSFPDAQYNNTTANDASAIMLTD